MGRYRVRDLWLVPGLLSLSRIPLAALFPFTLRDPMLAFLVLAFAGFTDVLDGWYARSFGKVTATGAALDPVTDKLFVTTVAVTLVVHGYLSAPAVFLLSTREIGELPLVLWLTLSRRARRARTAHPRSNVPGKLATALQFVSITAALFRSANEGLWIGATSIAGVVAAFTYWKTALRAHPVG